MLLREDVLVNTILVTVIRLVSRYLARCTLSLTVSRSGLLALILFILDRYLLRSVRLVVGSVDEVRSDDYFGGLIYVGISGRNAIVLLTLLLTNINGRLLILMRLLLRTLKVSSRQANCLIILRSNRRVD